MSGVSDQLASMQSAAGCAGRVTDIHVHILATGRSGSGCRLSADFMASRGFQNAVAALRGGSLVPEDGDLIDLQLDMVNKSERIGHAILHAMDGVYKNGRIALPDSHIIIPNEFIRAISGRSRRLLFGASVHPYREVTDMLFETDRWIGEGAALFQWVPSVQRIDPVDRRCIPFYMRLARGGVPLLCHTGSAFALPSLDSKNIEYNSPSKLRRALDIGVKVIISHCLNPAKCADPLDSAQFTEFIELMKSADRNRWELYADTSHLTDLPALHLEVLIREIGEGKISPRRLLFGSGFPMSSAAEKCSEKNNPLDYCCEVLLKSGLHDSIASNGRHLFASHMS